MLYRHMWKMQIFKLNFWSKFQRKKTRQIAEPFSRTVSYLFCTVLDLEKKLHNRFYLKGGGTSTNLGGQMLLVPNARARGSSLPGNMEVVNQDDIYRLRNFSTAGKKIVNRGDSVKARSRSSLASTCSR